MKLPLVLLVLIIFAINSGFSQNWQTFQSSSKKYFLTSEDYIFGVKFDSVKVTPSGDSILYPYKVLRNVYHNVPSASYSAIEASGAWFGQKLIIKANGDNIFLNATNDSIVIKTNCQLGDSFTLFKNDQDTITATVTSIDTATYYGVLDSVKTFDLTFSGQSVFINPKIVLGKQLGLTATLPFYDFPYPTYNSIIATSNFFSFEPYQLVGQDSPKMGITRPTFNDIFDFEIGDIIQYKSLIQAYFPVEYEEEKINQLVVLSKTLLPNDSAYYNILRELQKTDSSGNVTITIDTIELVCNISNNYYSKFMPEEFNHLHHDTTDYIGNRLMYNSCGFRQTLTSNNSTALSYDSLNNQYYYAIHFSTYYESAYSNAGDFYNTICSNGFIPHCSLSTFLIHKSNSNFPCGNRVYLAQEEFAYNNYFINAFPNPFSNEINVSSKEPIVSAEIYDMKGSKVFSKQHSSQLDVSHLKPGVYILVVLSENGIRKQKLIKP